MSQIIKYICLFIAGGAICWLFLRGCAGDEAKTKSLEDSLKIQQALTDTLIVKNQTITKQNDSVKKKQTADSVVFTQKIDSQTSVIAILKGKVKVGADSIGSLYSSLKRLYLTNDSVGLVLAYNELGQQLQGTKNELLSLQVAMDSADTLRSNEIDRLNGVISTLQSEINELKTLLKQSTDNSAQLAKNLNAALKMAKRNRLFAKLGTGLAVLLGAILLVK